ncbi:MAG: hypothetical protein U9R34_02550, partial [Nanoarchaeota archaeon]|nr:hypothetical protein [Nanoarchaeota archaeon]
ERDSQTHKVTQPGIIDIMPKIDAMKKDIFSVGVNNPQHYQTMKEVFDSHGVVLDPHGAVGWRALALFTGGTHQNQLAVIYETADPGKFPDDIEKAIGIIPEPPEGMKKQAKLEERIYHINSNPNEDEQGLRLSDAQVAEAKTKIKELLS